MCCFSGRVEDVSGTNIFARAGEGGRQLLAYQMTVSMKEPVAMILPLPVPAGAAEKALRWIDLKQAAELFTELGYLFEGPPKGASEGSRSTRSQGMLEVVDVGDFEASFVPALKDFSRLDARFRLSDAVWKKLPQYADWGFAVFKLKPEAKKVHPMGFEFPRRDPGKLFFPTVHIHDGEVHAKAKFDHRLYFQHPGDEPPQAKGWEESRQLAKLWVRTEKTAGLVLPDQHVHRRVIRGNQKNEDVLVAAA